jgi:hypothetical protein
MSALPRRICLKIGALWMTEPNAGLLWTQPEWLAGARAWIEDAVTRSGTRLTGPIDQFHIYPWSTVMRLPTGAGRLFFKATAPLSAVETRITPLLARAHPHVITPVVAVDPRRGWMITRDAGQMLRALLKTPEDLRILEPALPRFAEIQLEWTRRVDELLALGALDHRLAGLPARFNNLLTQRHLLLSGEHGLSEIQYHRLVETAPRYAQLCQRLAAHPVPISLHHDDFHDGNIFVLPGEAGAPVHITFSDWGDSCAAHPFSSLLILMRSLNDRVGFPESATEKPETLPAELNRLRDVYLEPFTIYEPLPRLREAFNLAWRVGMVARALSWKETIDSLAEPYRSKYAYTVPAWLGEYLLASEATM